MMSKTRYSPYAPLILAVFDLLILICIFFVFLYIHNPTWDKSIEGVVIFAEIHYKSLTLIILFWLLVASQVGLYKRFRFTRFLEILKKIFYQTIIFAVVLFAISGGKEENLYSSKESFYFLALVFSYLLVSRLFIIQALKIYRKKGFNLRKVILIGYNDNSEGLVQLLSEKNEFGLQIKDIFVTENPSENQTLLDLNVFNKYLIQNEIDFAYISLGNAVDGEMVNTLTHTLESQYIPVGFIPSTSLEVKQNLEINYLDTFPILTYKKYPLDHSFNQIVKRIFDLVFTFFVFVFILSWVYPIISFLILIYQGRPIHFSQKRNGLNGKEFSCLKFRSMRDDKLNSLKPTERDDPRVTKLGRILRKTSLDELPQFINVLKGEMSIVGPRPHMVSENESYSDIIKRYSLRHYVKPGITGLAQTRGYRGAVDSDKDMEMRIRTDIYYVRNWSFLLDILIIFRTVRLMIFGDENAI